MFTIPIANQELRAEAKLKGVLIERSSKSLSNQSNEDHFVKPAEIHHISMVPHREYW